MNRIPSSPSPAGPSSLTRRIVQDGRIDATDIREVGRTMRRHDVDGDGMVTMRDVFVSGMRGDWQTAIGALNTIREADFDRDGAVTVRDQMALAACISHHDADRDGAWELGAGEMNGSRPQPPTGSPSHASRRAPVLLKGATLQRASATGRPEVVEQSLRLADGQPSIESVAVRPAPRPESTKPEASPAQDKQVGSSPRSPSSQSRAALDRYLREKLAAELAGGIDDDTAERLSRNSTLLSAATADQKAVLVKALFDGPTGDDQELAAYRILASCRSKAELNRVVAEVGGWREVGSELEEEQYDRLYNQYNRLP